MDTKIKLELSDLEAKALASALFAIFETSAGTTVRGRLYDWQNDSLLKISKQLEAKRFNERI